MAKVIAIAAQADGQQYKGGVYALKDDGGLWYSAAGQTGWVRVPDPPDLPATAEALPPERSLARMMMAAADSGIPSPGDAAAITAAVQGQTPCGKESFGVRCDLQTGHWNDGDGIAHEGPINRGRFSWLETPDGVRQTR